LLLKWESGSTFHHAKDEKVESLHFILMFTWLNCGVRIYSGNREGSTNDIRVKIKRGPILQTLLAVLFTAIKVSGMSMFYNKYYVSLSTGENVGLYGVNFCLFVLMST